VSNKAPPEHKLLVQRDGIVTGSTTRRCRSREKAAGRRASKKSHRAPGHAGCHRSLPLWNAAPAKTAQHQTLWLQFGHPCPLSAIRCWCDRPVVFWPGPRPTPNQRCRVPGASPSPFASFGHHHHRSRRLLFFFSLSSRPTTLPPHLTLRESRSLLILPLRHTRSNNHIQPQSFFLGPASVCRCCCCCFLRIFTPLAFVPAPAPAPAPALPHIQTSSLPAGHDYITTLRC
jgi:hypothetical protein